MGENSHFWRGGVASQNHVLRNRHEVSAWRSGIFERDDFTCELCGQRGGRLTADHIVPWSVSPEMRFLPENGRTLCWQCHFLLPTTGAELSRLIRRAEIASERRASLHWVAIEAAMLGPAKLLSSGLRASRAALEFGNLVPAQWR